MDGILEELSPFVLSEVERYLATGDHEPTFAGWPGSNFLEVATRADQILRSALIAQVLERSVDADVSLTLTADELVAMTRHKVEPMVRGLFPRGEVEPVLATLERSVVFLTPQNIESVLRSTSYLHATWSLANLYLRSLGAEPLSPQALDIVGLSQETTCFVSMAYFEEDDACADYIVHEAAHIFHNSKRFTTGLRETRTREFLLDIDFRKRETFAYACEAYSRIVAQSSAQVQRLAALVEHAAGEFPGDEQDVDRQEYLALLDQAVRASNGWKIILAGCAPVRSRRRSGEQRVADQ